MSEETVTLRMPKIIWQQIEYALIQRYGAADFDEYIGNRVEKLYSA